MSNSKHIGRYNVQVYVYAKSEKSVLLLKRTPERSGYWQPVCGGVEENESYSETAIRELYEETGLEVSGDMLQLPMSFQYEEPMHGQLMNMEDHCFITEVNEKCQVTLSDEHVEYTWCSLSDVNQYTDWEPIITVTEYLMQEGY